MGYKTSLPCFNPVLHPLLYILTLLWVFHDCRGIFLRSEKKKTQNIFFRILLDRMDYYIRPFTYFLSLGNFNRHPNLYLPHKHTFCNYTMTIWVHIQDHMMVLILRLSLHSWQKSGRLKIYVSVWVCMCVSARVLPCHARREKVTEKKRKSGK